MILAKEQIQRYMRHIIIPEISGQGQKKLLESAVFVHAEDQEIAAAALYYLAAAGIGSIYCCFDNHSGCEALFGDIRDLNPDVTIDLFTSAMDVSNQTNTQSARLVIGSSGYISRYIKSLSDISTVYLPTVYAFANSWMGIIKTSPSHDILPDITDTLTSTISSKNPGDILSCCFAGTLAVIEAVKLLINIGTPCIDGIYYDLLKAEFEYIKKAQLSKYIERICQSSELDSKEMKSALEKAKVLIVGSGGLGSPIAYALARAGVGTLGLMDYDTVDISNLNRQIMHTTSRIGTPKVESAKAFLQKVNPELNVITYNTAFSRENAVEIINDYDMVADGLDNLPTRYLLNDACYFTKKPLAEAGVLSFFGLATTIIPDEGACYRCIFHEVPDNSKVPSCAETGVLGPVPGVLGFLQAAEILKLLCGISSTLKSRVLSFDALELELYITEFEKNDKCALCGSKPTIDALGDYKFVCESRQ